jgi:23S rRNA pseudouridine955/2504/2580 synthase
MRTLAIGPADHCRSLESLLRNLLPQAPTAYLRQLVRRGKVTVNGLQSEPTTLVLRGDSVQLRESGRTASLLTASPPTVDILYEDDRIMALNKPSGLAIHRTAEQGDQTLLDRAARFCEERGTPLPLRPVNRLDRGTSGAVILAKGGAAAGIFGRLVRDVGLSKLYLALVEGDLPPDGRIDLPVEGKESTTLFRVLGRGRGWAFVALWPLTGRMHQLRRHLAAVGAPVTGDRRYGSGTMLPDGAFCLHSFRTAFIHPETGRKVELSAPLPAAFIGILEGLSPGPVAPLLDTLACLLPLEQQPLAPDTKGA